MSDNTGSRDIAIVGYACKFAGANDVGQFWDNLKQARTSFQPIPSSRWNHKTFYAEHSRENDKTYVTTGGFIDDVDQFAAMHFGIAPRRVEVMDPQHRLVLDAVRVAMQDAGLEKAEFDRAKVGTFLGVSTSEYRNLITSRTTAMLMADGAFGSTDPTTDHAVGHGVENVAPISAFSMPGVLMNMAAANVAHQWKFGGPAFTVDAACTSSLVAVSDAVHYIRAGVCDMAIAGGVYLNLTPEAIVGFSRIGAISKKGACRPFDADADGFLQGDGVGIVVLKRMDQALADGDRIHAVIKGVGINNDGDSSGPMAPSVAGQVDVLRRAYSDANIDPKTVGFVECHGTATPVGDPVEIEALNEVFGEKSTDVFVASVKANIGHTMSSAGVAGLLHAVLSVEHAEITPQAAFETPNPKLDLEGRGFRVPTSTIAWESKGPRRAGVSAFGFGGTNCHIVVEQAPRTPKSLQTVEPTYVVLSAGNRELLAQHARRIAAEAHGKTLADIAFTLNSRALDSCRLAVVATSATELAELLLAAAPRIADAKGLTLGPDTFFAEGDTPGLAFMFPGQGAQRVGLVREIYVRYPAFAAHLQNIAGTVDELLPKPLLDYLYTDATSENEAALTQTEICQPAMAAIGLALDRFFSDLGIRPAVTLGHSLGEFVAAASGGLLDHASALEFVTKRGRMMADLNAPDFGAMAAVMASKDAVLPHLQHDVVVANINHPQQTVVAGPSEAVDAFIHRMNAMGTKATKLNVSHAFHSPVVEPVRKPLRAAIEALQFQEPTARVISAISKAEYTAANAAETFDRHATHSVDFVAALNLAAERAGYFVELGAGTTLTSFANGSLQGHTGARSVASKSADDARELHRTLAALAALGVSIDARLATPGHTVTLPATPLETQRYWIVRDKAVPLSITPKTAPQPTAETTMANPSDDLIALFRQQNEILQTHAALLAKQMEVLGFPIAPVASVPSVVVTAPTPPVVAQTAPTAPVEAQITSVAVDPAPKTLDAQAIVLEAIASVSAFPKDALKMEQQLAVELGFDSLMFVDLASNLTRAVPGLVVPQDAFSQKTTIFDVISFLENAAAEPKAAKVVVEKRPNELLTRYQVDFVEADLPPFEGNVSGRYAIAMDAEGFALQLANELAAKGIEPLLFGTMRAATKFPSFVADTSEHAFGELLQAHGNIDGLVVVIDHDDAIELTVELHALIQQCPEPLNAFMVIADETPAQQASLGFAKGLSREWTKTRIHALTRTAGATVEAVTNELIHHVHDMEVRLGATRLVPVLSASPIEEAVADWRNDVVLVTGGANGVGKMIADRLITLGAKVVTTGRSGENGVKGNCAHVVWDVNEPASPTTQQQLDVFGPITTLVHSAGIIRDGLAVSKTAKDVRDVVRVKTVGFQNALAASPNVKRVASFSSWAGRFGNRGQANYAAGNEAMRAMTGELRQRGIEAITFDWPAWDGTDMVTSIPASVREALETNGVTFIQPEEGIEAFFAEWGMGAAEVLFGRGLPAVRRLYHARFEASLKTMPWATDHKLRNRPVLPFAVALDMALHACNELAPGAAIALDDFELLRGVEVDEKTCLEIQAERLGNVVSIEITAHTGLQPFVAYRGTADLTNSAIPSPEVDTTSSIPATLDLANYYDNHSFHGPALRAIQTVERTGTDYAIGVLSNHGLELPYDVSLASPFVVDGSLQLVLYWLRSHHGSAAYPTSLKRYVQLRPFPSQVRCVLVLHGMDDDALEGSIRFETMDGELVAVMSHVNARIFERTQTASHPAASRKIDIDEKHWNIEKFPEVEALKQRLEMAALVGLRNPYFHSHDGIAKNKAIIDGKEMVNFSSYNYLGFSGHPEVTKAAQDAVARFGTSVSASRLASGEIPLHGELEREIAEFVGVDAALVFSAGHHANESVIGHLFGEGDLIIHDSLAHNSILTGAEMSGAKRIGFPHNDHKALDRMLTQLRPSYNKVGIMIEGVYSMDGDIPDLAKFLEIKERHRALLYVDEAHSIGCIGPKGAGVADYFGIDASRVDVWMGTLSKSFASCGGYIAGSSSLIEYLKYTVPGFIFSAGISPANSAAALASVKLMKKHPEVIHRLQARSKFFLERCQALGLDTGPSHDSAVVPCVVGNSFHCLQLSERLAARGINVQPIVYPAVDDDASRLRFFLSSTHTEEELEFTATVLAEELAAVRSGAAAE